MLPFSRDNDRSGMTYASMSPCEEHAKGETAMVIGGGVLTLILIILILILIF
jgi:hypothetical protein